MVRETTESFPGITGMFSSNGNPPELPSYYIDTSTRPHRGTPAYNYYVERRRQGFVELTMRAGEQGRWYECLWELALEFVPLEHKANNGLPLSESEQMQYDALYGFVYHSNIEVPLEAARHELSRLR